MSLAAASPALAARSSFSAKLRQAQLASLLGRSAEIFKVTPNKGPAAGGTPVTIAGEDFYGVTGVEFGGVAAENFTVSSLKLITATSPPHTIGKNTISVQTTFGPSSPEYCRKRLCTVRDYYAFREPTVETVGPGTGPTAGGTPVTITGTGFAVGTAGTEVLFGKALATSVECSSDTTCTAVAPPAAKSGAAYLKVTVTTDETLHSKKNPAARFVYE